MQLDRAKTEPCSHRAAHKPSPRVLAAAIAVAERRCLQHGIRWTPQRERALELLIEAGGPVKAYDLIPLFKAGTSTAPPTIYRALDTLVDLGLAHRIASLNAYTACHFNGEGHAASFLICDCCGGVEEIVPPTDHLLAAIKEQSAFKAAAITVEASGRCARCQG